MTEQDPKSVAGACFFATVAVLLFGGAYAMWPPGIFGDPFSDMTFAGLLRAAASLALVVIGLEFLGASAITALSET